MATSIYAILRRPFYHTQEGASFCFIPPFAYTMNGFGEEEVMDQKLDISEKANLPIFQFFQIPIKGMKTQTLILESYNLLILK